MPNTLIDSEIYIEPPVYIANSVATARTVAGPSATATTLTPNTGPFPILLLIGSVVAFDQPPQWFTWNATSTAADDGLTVLQATVNGVLIVNGRWQCVGGGGPGAGLTNVLIRNTTALMNATAGSASTKICITLGDLAAFDGSGGVYIWTGAAWQKFI